MITLLRIPLPKEKLRALPNDERALLLLLGYAANQISMFQKLVVIATNKTPSDPIEAKITGAHTQMIARFMIGVLNEGWRLVNERFIQTRIGMEYQGRLDSSGTESLTQLKRHFGGSNLLSKIRNNFAYHHPDIDDVEAAFELAASDKEWNDDWNWFFSAASSNSFYFAADVVILHGIMNAIKGTDLVSAQEKIMGEIRKVGDLMMDFIQALTAAIWLRHFGAEMMGEVCLEKDDAPSLWEYWLPFFYEVPEPPSE